MSTSTAATATPTASLGRLRRRVANLLIAGGLAAGLTVTAGTMTASAASPGVFNYVQCIPSSGSIVQAMEAYRSFAGEYVVLQGALVNTATMATFYSQWLVGTGSTAYGAIDWTNVVNGEYSVFYRWASWNSTSAEYTYSGWVQVTGAALNTYGYESYQGSGVFIGGSSGRCAI